MRQPSQKTRPALADIERRLGHPGLFADVRKVLEKAFGSRLKGVVLYGSQARGDAGPGSDVDLLLLLDGADYAKDLRVACRALLPFHLAGELCISIQLAVPEEYEAGERAYYRNVAQDEVRL